MKRLVRRIVLISPGGGNGQFIIVQETSSGNLLGEFYRKLPMGLMETIFGEQLKHLSVRRGELNYTEIFVGIQT